MSTTQTSTLEPSECVTMTAEDPNVLKALVFLWCCRHPGKDAEHCAAALGISGLAAVVITGELLEEGLLEFSP